MGRRNDHNPEEFNELVLTQVEEFLTHLPASQLSLRKVAKMIGYAPSTLIHTYKNWSMLLLKVNARTLDRLMAKLTPLEQEIADPEQRLYAIAEAYCAFACKQPHLWTLVFEHKLPAGIDIPGWMQQRINQLFGLFALISQRVSICNQFSSNFGTKNQPKSKKKTIQNHTKNRLKNLLKK